MPTQILIFIEISKQITEFACEHPHLYTVRLSQYKGAKLTKSTWASDAVELDIEVSCQCYTYLLLCVNGLN